MKWALTQAARVSAAILFNTAAIWLVARLNGAPGELRTLLFALGGGAQMTMLIACVRATWAIFDADDRPARDAAMKEGE